MSLIDLLITSGSRGIDKPGFGRAATMPRLLPWRSTSRQVCGLYPLIVGDTAPLVGVPLGRVLGGWGTVCADPISWFEKGLISAPSSMVLGLNGLGKSSLVRRIVTGSAYMGVHSMVLGDIKPDYVDLISALGGQIIRIGHGHSGINPLDAGNVEQAAKLLENHPQERSALLAAAHERKKTMVLSLIQIIRGSSPSDREENVIEAALTVLENTYANPVLADLLQVVRDAPEPVRMAALDRGSLDRYKQVTEELEASLMALLNGRLGGIFASATTTPMMMDRSVVFDVHDMLHEHSDLQAAVLLASWSYGFATVEISQTLADAGVAPRHHYMIVMDELWRILRASSGMVERIDSLTRLNRTVGVGQMMLTHSMADFQALSEADRLKAQGFVERSKMLFLGGLPGKELDLLRQIMGFSQAEEALLNSWNAPGTYDPLSGKPAAPAGRGKFLLKTSSAPGIPFQVQFSQAEKILNNTNQRWNTEGK